MDAIPDIVDAVLYFLAALSVLVWTIAIGKFFSFSGDANRNRRFIKDFDAARDVGHLTQIAGVAEGSLARLGASALNEVRVIQRLLHLSRDNQREMLLHAIRKQAHTEQVRMENGLGVLASVGSTAPFIGLFGTVWGIMHALKNITATGSAGLDVVAGPIGEALIATAIGIATAVPAVLAYNYYLRRVKLAVSEMDQFASAFMNFLVKTGSRGE